MIEGFVLNVVAALFYDTAKFLLDKRNYTETQVEALKGVYKQALIVTTKTFDAGHNERQTKRLRRDMAKLVNNPNACYILLDLALDKGFDIDEVELRELCKQTNLNYVILLPFLTTFLQEVKLEFYTVAEEHNNPLFNMAVVRSQNRIESKLEEMSQNFAAKEQFDNLKHSVSGMLAKRLEATQKNWEAGQIDNVLSTLREVRTNKGVWESISTSIQAEWLRTEAIFLLEIYKDVETAKQLHHQAQELDPKPQDDKYIKATIAFVENNYEETLKITTELVSERIILLRAITLIEMSRHEDAQNLLDLISASSNIHIHFTKARLALLQHDVELALQHIQTAQHHAPKSPDMKFWEAQLKYLSVLAPARQPTIFQILPEPILPTLYRSTPKYRKRLEEAAITFEELCEQESNERWKNAHLWYLACLLNLGDTEEKAVSYCQQLIDTHPMFEFALAWAANYNLPINYTDSIAKLRAKIADTPVTTNTIIALAACYLHENEMQAATDLLIEKRAIFENRSLDIWHHTITLAYLQSGDIALAEEHIRQIGDSLEQRRMQALLLRQSDDIAVVEALLQHDDYADDPLLLLDVCSLAKAVSNWDFIAKYANVLFDEINTPYAFELIIYATYVQDIAHCLSLIDRLISDYSPEPIYWQYRNIRVRCWLQTGFFREAYHAARELYNEIQNANTFTTLAMVYNHIGDLENLAVLARHLLSDIDVDPMDCLKIAEMVSLTDVDLATRLWRKAATKELPDEFVKYAVILANTLGINSETEELFYRVNQLAQQNKAGFQSFTLREMAEFIHERQQFSYDTYMDYQKGQHPVQIATNYTSASLAWLYHERLEAVENVANFHPYLALMARFGGRPTLQNFDINSLQGHIAIDLTSLLLTAHFDILEAIEQTFSPLRISQLSITALVEMLLQYHAQDRKRIEACQQIIQFTEQFPDNVIQLPIPTMADPATLADLDEDWIKLYSYAIENDAYFVNFFPIHKRGLDMESAVLPQDADQYLADTRSVLDALLKYRVITKTEYQNTLQALGNTGKSTTQLQLHRGAKLVFYANSLEHIASHDMLRKAAKIFEITIYKEQIEDARKVVKGETSIHRIKVWLSQLINHLFEGIIRGTYNVLPLRPLSADADIPDNLETQSLIDLVSQCQSAEDVIVIDDRFWNSYLRSEKAHLLSSTDLLRALFENGWQADEYYHLLTRIRQANIRYIPYQISEIIYHLTDNYEATDLEIVETPSLKTMAAYINACLSQTEILQLDSSGAATNQESLFIHWSFQEIIGTIGYIWMYLHHQAMRVILSEWVLENLYLPNRDIFIKYGFLQPSASSNDFAFPEVYEISKSLRVTPDSGGFSTTQRFRIWLWQWFHKYTLKDVS